MAKKDRIEGAADWTFMKYYDYIIEKIKKNLHIVIYMSPIGNTLRMKIT